mgnify:CR=1 FL=1
MNCIDCPHFKIAYWPIKADKGYWDLGRAVCEKHDLVTDFANRGKLKRLECVENGNEKQHSPQAVPS